MFFSLDGIDGVGKSTQMELFVEYLEDNGHSVLTCRDPGSTRLGEAIRAILLQDMGTPICGTTEMLLYMAARAQMVEEIIKPALAMGKVVVSDRYLLANVVYQGWAGDLAPEIIWQVGEIATDQLKPDLTLILDLPLSKARERIGSEPDRMESRGIQYQESLRNGFLEEAARKPERLTIIDAEGTINEVAERIQEATAHFLRGTTK